MQEVHLRFATSTSRSVVDLLYYNTELDFNLPSEKIIALRSKKPISVNMVYTFSMIQTSYFRLLKQEITVGFDRASLNSFVNSLAYVYK